MAVGSLSALNRDLQWHDETISGTNSFTIPDNAEEITWVAVAEFAGNKYAYTWNFTKHLIDSVPTLVLLHGMENGSAKKNTAEIFINNKTAYLRALTINDMDYASSAVSYISYR